MGFFTCCTSDRKQSRQDAETRHTRIIEVYRQAEIECGTPVPSPPPAYNEIVHNNISGTTIFVNEKSPQALADPQPQFRTQHFHVRGSISRPASPQTSIYSVPSTRLTDITSAHTGGTLTVVRTHQGDSPRSSLAFDSAPPSYYDDRSIRERSRSPHSQRQSDEQQQHPVMAEDWLEVLRGAAGREQR